jgi:hypothetical protein
MRKNYHCNPPLSPLTRVGFFTAKTRIFGIQSKWSQFRHSREGLESRSNCYRKDWILSTRGDKYAAR